MSEDVWATSLDHAIPGVLRAPNKQRLITTSSSNYHHCFLKLHHAHVPGLQELHPWLSLQSKERWTPLRGRPRGPPLGIVLCATFCVASCLECLEFQFPIYKLQSTVLLLAWQRCHTEGACWAVREASSGHLRHSSASLLATLVEKYYIIT